MRLILFISSLFSSLFSHLIPVYYHVTAQPRRGGPNQRPRFGFYPPASSASQIRLKGLCQDGWTEGSSQDIHGNKIPICLRINGKSETWEDAKATCRQDFGFLLKLDSPVKVDENDLMSVLLSKGTPHTDCKIKLEFLMILEFNLNGHIFRWKQLCHFFFYLFFFSVLFSFLKGGLLFKERTCSLSVL